MTCPTCGHLHSIVGCCPVLPSVHQTRVLCWTKRDILLVLFLMFAGLSTSYGETVYEDAEDGDVSRWRVYDTYPTGALIRNEFDETSASRVVTFDGSGTGNGYILGGVSVAARWNNRTETVITWSMKFSQRYVVYVRAQTTNGLRYLTYTSLPRDKGLINNRYAHHGLGSVTRNGQWQTISRDLVDDLHAYEPNNQLIAVHAFLVRGSGSVDDVTLSTGDTTDPDVQLNTMAESARLLTQATFGPTLEDINNLLSLPGLNAYLEEQKELPPSLHLPRVKALHPDGWAGQTGRYSIFWEHALHAPDQLRQRVALALSEIMVVSDIPDVLINHGNMLATYYDVLVTHALGNYRDLLEAVTLNPAMGVYLSMLGNDKPDVLSSRRADENYAREIMQLFSIGLEQLNIAGDPLLDQEGVPLPSYTQSDVENLARVFTGWSWDAPAFSVSPLDGWYPDLTRMERPMRAFAGHHDSDNKRILGQTINAGQTPAQDLTQALDIIFNHTNVGPFIGKQLIQRLVTSNPSPGYIRRVARVFNDNGQGQRGDLYAVVKAILSDNEARSTTTAAHIEYGKLREPILRFSHLWRAFSVTDSINVGHFRNLMSQHAPLTAPSVFNFFSPGYSPPGELKDANLVAPEFQINSETWVNTVNGALEWIVQRDSFFNLFGTRLDLSKELSLVDTPSQLIDHLDVLLLSGGMTDAMRNILARYLNDNAAYRSDEERVRDVITLIVTSAQYAVQR